MATTPARRQRPSDDLIETICQLIAAGNPVEEAALYSGVTKTELKRWLDAGAHGSSRFNRFNQAVQKAAAEADLRDMAVVAKSDDWKAAAWRIDRRRQDRLDDELERMRGLTTD